jgi:hypothetical protein
MATLKNAAIESLMTRFMTQDYVMGSLQAESYESNAGLRAAVPHPTTTAGE